jgi:excisionase family DNA binding protein
MPEYMTRREVCAVLRISATAVDDLVKAGRIRKIRVTERRVIYPRADIDRILRGEAAAPDGAGGAATP